MELAGEADRGLLGDAHPLVHAGAGIDQQGQRNRLLRARKEREVLFGAVFIDFEIGLGQVGGVFAAAVDDGDVERDELDAAADALALRRNRGGGERGGDERGRERAHYLAPACALRVRA